MKQLLLILLLLSIAPLTINAQEIKAETSQENFNEPEFPGGKEAFFTFIKKQIKNRHLPSKTGKLVVSFIVEKDGSLSNIHIVEGIEETIDERILKIIAKSPKWKPATVNGELKRASYQLPITITIGS